MTMMTKEGYRRRRSLFWLRTPEVEPIMTGEARCDNGHPEQEAEKHIFNRKHGA